MSVVQTGRQASAGSHSARRQVMQSEDAEQGYTAPVVPEAPQVLRKLTCSQLKERLRLRGLPVGGIKEDLVARLAGLTTSIQRPKLKMTVTAAAEDMRQTNGPAQPAKKIVRKRKARMIILRSNACGF